MNAALQSQIEASPYLSGLLNKYPFLSDGLTQPPLPALAQICASLAALDVSLTPQEIEKSLIEAKVKFAFTWSLAELSDIGDFSERGEWQTRFAELTIDAALKAAWQEVAQKQAAISRILEQYPDQVPGLFIVGMGKLGGGDLNFSSDIDLVAFYEPETLPVADALGKSYICQQVLRTLTRILGQNGHPNFIWRVDWRLRPNASATTLAMSTSAAKDYYFFRASPWHRLALMKARVVAGDKPAGQTFMNAIIPFIWRQNLDYRALDELAETKNRINLEHPSLRAQRRWREPISDEVGGYNVKLGTGGIREIEFIANALQLIWGGRHYGLRTPNTLLAIRELARLKLLQTKLADQLVCSYRYLRRVENAIQILGNQQTHLIATECQGQQRLVLLLAEAGWSVFVAKLNRYRRLVSAQFEALFAEQAIPDEPNIRWPEQLSALALEIVGGWEEGFSQYGVAAGMRHRLKPLGYALANYLTAKNDTNAEAEDASVTVLRLHDFFLSLPRGEQYFRLLAESPDLLESIIPPLLYSPAMSTLLRQSPHIIDCFLGDMRYTPERGFDSEYVMLAESYEVRLERLRRFVNEHLYQLYLMFMQGESNAEEFQRTLSALAEHTLELALSIVTENLQLAEPPITVLGMGKIALGKMSPLSDLDLIFIFDSNKTTLEQASKFVARLQTAISTPMREGIVYELDTRLRPSGRSGAPTLSIDSFASHQIQRAHTWEHIALLPSRVVAGDRSVSPAIEAIKRQIINTPRDPQQLRNDALKMWDRIAAHRLEEFDATIMFSKLRPGGLMQAEYVSACLILLSDCVVGDVEFAALLAQAIEYQLAKNPELRTGGLQQLLEILQFWRVQQLWERLLGLTEKPLDNVPAAYLKRLLADSQVDSMAELLHKKQNYSQTVLGIMEAVLIQPMSSSVVLEKWQEEKVQWLPTARA